MRCAWIFGIFALFSADLVFARSDDKPAPAHFVARTQSKDCQNVGLNAGSTGALAHQGEIGWCYAYATARILSQALGVPVSAMDVAIVYNYMTHDVHGNWITRMQDRLSGQDQMGERTVTAPDGKSPMTVKMYKPFEGGSAYDAILAIQEAGVCPESAMTPVQAAAEKESTRMLIEFGVLRSLIGDGSQWAQDVRCAMEETSTPIVGVFPHLEPAQTIFDVLEKSSNDSYTTELFELSKKNCGKERLFPGKKLAPVLRLYPNGVQERIRDGFLSEADRLLNQGKMATLAVNSADYVSGKRSTLDGLFKDPSGGHEVALTGREFKNGRCYYRINDSAYGACNQSFVAGVECDPKTLDILVPEDVLLKMSRGMTYLK